MCRKTIKNRIQINQKLRDGIMQISSEGSLNFVQCFDVFFFLH